MTRRLFNYYVQVHDPHQNQVVQYHFRAFTDEGARQQALNAYTGLLGNPKQGHLAVQIISKELGGTRPGDF